MKLILQRIDKRENFCNGTLSIKTTTTDKFSDTVEPGTKSHHPCIPAGTYEIKFWMSERFKRVMPFLQNVPGRDAIEIHAGNVPLNTRGCILVGCRAGKPWEIKDSKATLERLLKKMTEAAEGITIEIFDPVLSPVA